MAICDASYKFILADVGQKGSGNDAGIWELSQFCNGLEQGNINLPQHCTLPNDRSGKLFPHMLLGDEAFPLRTFLMRPYPGRVLDDISRRIFNYRLSRARRVIENCFGILTQRWRLLMRPIIAHREKATKLVQAMCALHNYLCVTQDANYIPAGFADGVGRGGELRNGFWRQEAIPPLNGLDTVNRSMPGAALEIRERMREYFSGDGSTDWQLQVVNRR